MATVLLVDDDLENQWALQLALESRGHHVVLADDGRAALRKTAACFPQIVITDLEMPEMDGRQLSRHLRCQPAFSKIPVVLLSAMPEPDDEVRHWSAFLRKPASIASLLDTVDAFIAARLTYTRAARTSEHHIPARWQAIDSRCWP